MQIHKKYLSEIIENATFNHDEINKIKKSPFISASRATPTIIVGPSKFKKNQNC